MKNKSLVLGRNIFANFFAQGIIFVVAFITTPLILRGLGETNYSLLVFLGTIINFMLALDFGIIPAFVQSLAEKINQKDHSSNIFYSSLIVYGLLILFWATLTYYLSPLLLSKFFPINQQIGSIATTGLRLFSLILIVGGLSNFLAMSMQSLQKFHLFSLRAVILGLSIPVGTVYLLANNKSILDIIYLHLIIHTVTLLIFILLAVYYLPLAGKIRFSWQEFKKIYYFARWKFVSQLAGQIRQKSGRFFIGAYLNLGQLAFFSIPQNISERFITLQPNINMPIFAMVARLKGENKQDALISVYKQLVKMVNVFFLSLGIFVFFYAKPFLSLWIGPDFAAKSYMALQFLMIGMCAALLNGVPTVFLEGLGRPKTPAKFSIFIAGLSIFLSFLLIPRYGVNGAALTVMLTYTIQAPIYLHIVSKKIIHKANMSFYLVHYLLPILIAFGVGLLTNTLTGPVITWTDLIRHFALYLLFYYIVIFALKLIGSSEINVIKKMAHNIWKK